MSRLIVLGAVVSCLVGALLIGPAQAQQGRPPFAGGGAGAEKDPAADKLEAAAVKLEKQLKAKPKDAKLKLQVADAFYKAGHAKEYSDKLSPRAKYRGALKDYRVALKYNPNHAEAAREKKQIED